MLDMSASASSVRSMSAGSGAVRSSSLPVRGCETAAGGHGAPGGRSASVSASSGDRLRPSPGRDVAQRDAVPARVELVGQDRVADVGEVDADLVGAAGLRLAPDQREAAEPLDDLVEGHRGLAAVLERANGHLLADVGWKPIGCSM